MPELLSDQAAAGVFTSSDPDAFAAALLGGEFEYLPLPGQPFAATLRTLRVGDVVVQQAADAPHITRAAFQRGLTGLIVPRHLPGRTPSANGTMLHDRNALLLPGGADFTVACPDPQDWGAVALPDSMVEDLRELGATASHGSGIEIMEIAAPALVELGAVFAAAGRMAADMPDILAAPGCADGLAASLRELVATTITAGFAPPARGRAAREATRVLRGADDYLRSHLDRPIYRDDLCAALGVSRRKLHDAFVAVVGMSPPAYLKLRRLVLARRALRAGDGDKQLVKAVALSHGFWHLGYFANDYRALFGELPSQTALRRVQV
jgi:AraC-like DNA-binding protein